MDEAELKLAFDIARDIGEIPEILAEMIEEQLEEHYAITEETSPWQGFDHRDRVRQSCGEDALYD